MTDNQRKEILREKIKNHRQEYMNSLPYVYEEAICEAMTQSEKLFAIEQLNLLFSELPTEEFLLDQHGIYALRNLKDKIKQLKQSINKDQ